MTKRLFCLLAALLLALSFAGIAEEEIYPCCDFDLDAYGGMLNIVYADGSTDETGGWGFSAEITRDGMTLGDILKNFDIAQVEAVNEEDTFEGWLVFNVEVSYDEDGFSDSSYVLTSETPVSTDALLALPAQEGYTAFAAKWAGIPAEEYFQDTAEEYETIRIPAVTLYTEEGSFLMQAEEENYESGMSVATCEPGQTVGEVLELDKLLDVTREGYEFTGWTVYDVAWMETIEGMPEEEDLPCFEVFDGWYCVLYDYSVIGENMSTEEIGALECGETDLFIIANWA